jgi:hypothetical protein
VHTAFAPGTRQHSKSSLRSSGALASENESVAEARFETAARQALAKLETRV